MEDLYDFTVAKEAYDKLTKAAVMLEIIEKLAASDKTLFSIDDLILLFKEEA